MIPDPYGLVLLGLAVYRTWHLLAIDSILDGPRDAITLPRPRLDAFVGCPWCFGFWIAGAWWAAWWWWPQWTLAVAVLGALATVPPALSRLLDG